MHALCRVLKEENVTRMSELLVVRRRFEIEDPWGNARDESVRLVRATDGASPVLSTTVTASYDDAAVSFVFSGEDDAVHATMLEHDAPLWREDVVEVFLAPSSAAEYFELEVNPLGTTFDARILSPDGVRSTMRAELDWTCDGLFAAIQRTTTASGTSFEVVIRIPFASLGCPAPQSGEAWRGNLFRIDRHERGDEFTAWRPTLKTVPDFHVVGAFGVIRFA